MNEQETYAKIGEIERKIRSTEDLRGVLDDETITNALANLNQQKEELLSQLSDSDPAGQQVTHVGSGALAQGPGAAAVGAGGVMVDGNVSGGIITGNNNEMIQAQGDVVKGDNVGGDRIDVGDISNATGVAIGRNASATVTQGLSGQELIDLFNKTSQGISARPEDPDVDKDEIEAQVTRIVEEADKVDKGEDANESKLARLIRSLADMAPDIVDVMAASLAGPVAGGAMVLKKIINKVQSEQAA